MTVSCTDVLRVDASRTGEVRLTPPARQFVESVVSRMRETMDLTTAAFWLTPYREHGREYLDMAWRDMHATDIRLTFRVLAEPEAPTADTDALWATVHDMTSALLLARLIADGAVANAWGRI
jgi:monomeric isocitrate dehydrogenase